MNTRGQREWDDGMRQLAWGSGHGSVGIGKWHGYVEDIYVSTRICIYIHICTSKYKPYLDEDVDVY
jgi:hypothetical protein